MNAIIAFSKKIDWGFILEWIHATIYKALKEAFVNKKMDKG
jgi:hypothetical protein